MYTFPVQTVYLVDTVKDNPKARARAERLYTAFGCDEPVVITRSEMTELYKQRQANQPADYAKRTGSFDYSTGWTIFLTTYDDGDSLRDGMIRSTFRDGTSQMGGIGVCQSALELHGAYGCYHRCDYCFCDPFFVIACDLESLAERVPGYCQQYPEQQLYKFDNYTDTIVLEPEYGASELLVPLFAGLEQRYLLLYTKSDNIEHLLPLDHGGHTIVNWSLSPMRQSTLIEKNTPDMARRIEAMVKCQAAGYPVRVRISPIVPLCGWREDIAAMVEALFSVVKPDCVTVDVVGWCCPEALADAMDIELLEAPYLDYLESIMGQHDSADKYLFSHELRLPVFRHTIECIAKCSPKTPVAICNETRHMWRALDDLLTMEPDHYVCCCGPNSVALNRG